MTRSVAVYAQEYVPIIQEGNVWNTLDVTAGMYNTYRGHNHNHPENTPYPSGLYTGKSDIGFSNNLTKISQENGSGIPTFKIYLPATGNYIEYSGEYYLSIDRFDANNNILKSISYYVIINDIVFFVSSRVATDIIKVLPSQKEFDINNENSAIIGGDYHFLIWRTISGYYYILLSTCSE